MKKSAIFLAAAAAVTIFVSLDSLAAPLMAKPSAPFPWKGNSYVEYKNEYDVAKESQTHHLRAGYKTKGGYYLEAGKMNAGWSSEVGYKQKFGNFELKGKFETKKHDYSKPKSKLETELRYTFK